MTTTVPHGVSKISVVEAAFETELAELNRLSHSSTTEGGFETLPSTTAALSSRADALVQQIEDAMHQQNGTNSGSLPHLLREASALSGRLFLRKKGVPKLLDSLVQQVVASRPSDPIAELVRLIDLRRLDTTTAIS